MYASLAQARRAADLAEIVGADALSRARAAHLELAEVSTRLPLPGPERGAGRSRRRSTAPGRSSPSSRAASSRCCRRSCSTGTTGGRDRGAPSAARPRGAPLAPPPDRLGQARRRGARPEAPGAPPRGGAPPRRGRAGRGRVAASAPPRPPLAAPRGRARRRAGARPGVLLRRRLGRGRARLAEHARGLAPGRGAALAGEEKAPFLGTPALVPAAEAHRRALEAARGSAPCARATRRVAAELALTARRLRTIERRWLPEHRDALHELELRLDEEEREESGPGPLDARPRPALRPRPVDPPLSLGSVACCGRAASRGAGGTYPSRSCGGRRWCASPHARSVHRSD